MKRLISALAMITILSGCAVWPMGEDPKGKEFRSQADTLVAAIVAYKEKNGSLPEKLNDLVPAFLNALPEVANYSFYLPKESGLIYNYSPSWPQQGRTSCSTTIGSGKWGCHGYI